MIVAIWSEILRKMLRTLLEEKEKKFIVSVSERFEKLTIRKTKFLCFFVDYVIKMPFLIARAISKLYEIIVIFLEKLSEFMED